MDILFYPLASGSSGNATLIVCGKTLFLVDFGIAEKEVKAKVEELGYRYQDINYILITHGHRDHVKHLPWPLHNIAYSSCMTIDDIEEDNIIEPYNTYKFNDVEVTVLPMSHDSFGTLGFVFKYADKSLGYISDTGYINRTLFAYLKNLDYYIIESNHDVPMLMKSKYPPHLKKRILSDYGHLSNLQASIYLMSFLGEKSKTIVLVHLSEEANTPQLALQCFYQQAELHGVDVSSINVCCALRHDITRIGVRHGN